jgi:hypothetical protein
VTDDFAGRDAADVDALVTDRYLDSLLAAHAHGTDHGPSAEIPPDPLRSVADHLARDLPRYHPSFRFEEALAERLASVAAAIRSRSGDQRSIVRFPFSPAVASDEGNDPARRSRTSLDRPWIVGGALTSAALSLAGAVYVAWRRGRQPRRARVV